MKLMWGEVYRSRTELELARERHARRERRDAWLIVLAAVALLLTWGILSHAIGCDHNIAPATDSARVWIEGGPHLLGGGSADAYLLPSDPVASDTLRIMVRYLSAVWSSWVVIYTSAAIDTAWQSIRPMPSQPLLWWKPHCCSPWRSDPAPQLLDSGIARAAVVFNYGSDGRTGTLELGRIVVHNHSATVGSRIWIALDNPGRARQAGHLSASGKPVQANFDCPSEVQFMVSGTPVGSPRLYRSP